MLCNKLSKVNHGSHFEVKNLMTERGVMLIGAVGAEQLILQPEAQAKGGSGDQKTHRQQGDGNNMPGHIP